MRKLDKRKIATLALSFVVMNAPLLQGIHAAEEANNRTESTATAATSTANNADGNAANTTETAATESNTETTNTTTSENSNSGAATTGNSNTGTTEVEKDKKEDKKKDKAEVKKDDKNDDKKSELKVYKQEDAFKVEEAGKGKITFAKVLPKLTKIKEIKLVSKSAKLDKAIEFKETENGILESVEFDIPKADDLKLQVSLESGVKGNEKVEYKLLNTKDNKELVKSSVIIKNKEKEKKKEVEISEEKLKEELKKVPAKNVKYIFHSKTAGQEIPQGVLNLLPKMVAGEVGDNIKSPKLEKTSIRVAHGTWNFIGYDKEEVSVTEAGQIVVGSWTYEADKSFDVNYEFVSGTKNMQLPDSVKELTPKASENLYAKDKVKSPTLETTTVRGEHGTWAFKSWDQDSVTIKDSDVKVVGTWVYAEDAKYKLDYKFVSDTKDKELPKEVKDLLPKESEEKYDGEEVELAKFEKSSVKVDGGTWTIMGLYRDNEEVNKDTKTVKLGKVDDKHNNTITVKWIFTEDAKFTTKYVDESGKALKDDIVDVQFKDKEEFDGYKYMGVEEKDNVRIYKFQTIKTHYVLESTRQDIKDPVLGNKDKEDIKGYYFVKTEIDDKGQVYHIYKELTTNWVELENPSHKLKQEVKGLVEKFGDEEIGNYVYSKTEKDAHGNIIHYYTNNPKKLLPKTGGSNSFVTILGDVLTTIGLR